MDFNVLLFSGSVNKTPSNFSQPSDAHCSADSVHFAVLCLLDWSHEIILVIGDTCGRSRISICVMCISLIFKTSIACLQMLKNHFCPPILSFGGVGGKTHTFEVAHSRINMFRADDFVSRFVSGLEFEICKIRRKQTIRIGCLMIGVWLVLLL